MLFASHLIYMFLSIIVFSFSLIIRIWSSIRNIYIENVDDRYDYIIVGGGSAGSIVAGRLSENENVTVLLIEAGGESHDLLNIPILGPLKQLTDVDWQYSTVSQKHSCFGLENNVSKWPSGKILGGSTHLNYMIYHEAHGNDFKTWKDPDFNDWDDKDVKYYFDKALKYSKKKKNSKQNGSINIREALYLTELSRPILIAANELGFKMQDDNVSINTGFRQPKLHLTDFGMRWTSDQFIRNTKVKRKNLKLLTNTVVEEILFLDDFEAYGVKIRRGESKNEVIYANIEVIVSAGSVGSPKLLMLSGIGPSVSLTAANISTKIDLPVGKNLQDHVTTGLDLGIMKSHLFSFNNLIWPYSAYEYFIHGRGPYTSGLVDAIGVVHSPLVDPRNSSPDLEFLVMSAGISSDKGVFLRHAMGISQKSWDEYFSFLTNEYVVSLLPVVLHPKSRGEIQLNAENPKGMPRIDPKYLSDEEDVTTLVQGIKILRKLMKTKTLRKFGLKLNDKSFPGCGAWKFDSYEYWRCYVKHLTLTVYHPAGTCKMGKLKDNGVVDYRLRVHGTNKLRVIDASVMPSLPSANPMSTVIMIAEKGADMIKEDFYKRFSTCSKFDVFMNLRICF